MAASSTLTWNKLRRSYSEGAVLPRWRLLFDDAGLGIALDHDQAAAAMARCSPALPATPARHSARRTG